MQYKGIQNDLTFAKNRGKINIASNFAEDLIRGVSKIKPPHNEYVVGLYGCDTATWIFGIKIDVGILSNIIKVRKDYHGENMKFIADIKEFSENSNNPDLNTMINFPIENKSVILRFLKSFEPVAVMAHGVMDYVKNTPNNSESIVLFNSDEWFWTNEMIYHFDKYDLKLNNDFIEYVCRVIDMRFIPSEKVRKLRKEIEPYLIVTIDGVIYKEGTPAEIKEKHKLWSQLYDEESKKAEEFYG